MATQQATPIGNARIVLTTPSRPERPVIVGRFSTLGGARRLAEDLIADGAVRSVLVQHRNKGAWRPAWSYTEGVTR